MRTKYILIFIKSILLLTFTNPSLSQEKLQVTSVGTSLSMDLTPKQALKEAIREAKINALIEAGIQEQVGALRVLIKSGTEDEITQSFSQVNTSEFNAYVVVDSIHPDQKSFHDEFGHMKVTVRIDATVFKYDQKNDPTFFYDVRNLKDTYYTNESISFTLIPSQDGYLKIFAINEKESILLYPYKHPIASYLSDDSDYCFKAGETVSFPIHDAYKPGYSMEVRKGKLSETSLLLFVFTKDNFRWVEQVTPSAIYNRIANISPNRRKVSYYPILIKLANK